MTAFDERGNPLETCPNCGGVLVTRPDDSEGVVRDRLKVYWRDTQPLVTYYQPRPRYRAVNGAQTPDRVRDELVKAVAEVLGHPAGDGKQGVTSRSEKNA
jgi:adenylate kinase family enzyme